MGIESSGSQHTMESCQDTPIPTGLSAIKGVHPGISDDDYFAHGAVNNSSLSTILTDGPEKFYDDEVLGNRKKSTAAMDLGTIVHDIILRPDEIDRVYVKADSPVNPSTGEPFGTTSKKYNAWRDTYKDRGQSPLTPQDHNLARRLCGKAYTHPIAGPLLRASSSNECGLFFHSERHGLELKCKLDSVILNPDRVPEAKGLISDELLADVDVAVPGWRDDYAFLIPDIKTTAQFMGFKKVLRDRNYYRAEAFYTYIASQIFGGAGRMIFLAVETTGLDRVKACVVGDDDMLRGQAELDNAIGLIHGCMLRASELPPDRQHEAWADPANDVLSEVQLFKGTW